LKPWTYPEFIKDDALAAGTDIAYRTGYRACAGGPFNQRVSFEAPMPKFLIASQQEEIESWNGGGQIELWDNDGIVNTASMLWPPDAENTVLVVADHMDIVGHYKLAEAAPGSARRYRAYDLLGSASGFADRGFQQVWHDVFDYCASHLASQAAQAAAGSRSA
jgi:hypothetical protein